MGLDMYLYARKYTANYSWFPQENEDLYHKILEVADKKNLQGIDANSLTIEFEAMYWRKANAIHGWFVDNVQNGIDNCKPYEVFIPQLYKLLDICEQVIENPAKAKELLPAKSGFFFGGTEYDEWYFNSVEYTAERLNQLLKVLESDNYILLRYQSSW